MKAIVCEMCGDTNLIKQDGVYVCQSCGTKYSVEEAKNMMVDGVVDVQGTVKVDNTDKLNNMYTLARRAKEQGDSEEACKYYEQISLERPDDWEAQFFKMYYRCMQTKIAYMGSSCIKLGNSLENVFKMITENIEDAEEREKAYKEVYYLCGEEFAPMIVNNIVSHGKSYSDPSNALEFAKEHISGVVMLYIDLGDACKNIQKNDWAVSAYKNAASYAERYTEIETRRAIENKIIEIEPTYVSKLPAPGTVSKSSSDGGCGCLIIGFVFIIFIISMLSSM